jgi:hypothetical protein
MSRQGRGKDRRILWRNQTFFNSALSQTTIERGRQSEGYFTLWSWLFEASWLVCRAQVFANDVRKRATESRGVSKDVTLSKAQKQTTERRGCWGLLLPSPPVSPPLLTFSYPSPLPLYSPPLHPSPALPTYLFTTRPVAPLLQGSPKVVNKG